MNTKIDSHQIDDVIKANLDKFNKPGALTVRPGFKISDGWITGKPAIVVTVDKKIDGLPKDHQLPTEVDKVPVDVREATGLQRLRAKSSANFDLAAFHSTGEKQEPTWKFERDVKTGMLVPPANSSGSKAGLHEAAAKTQINYAPANVPLDKFIGHTTIIACASPDDGFPVLIDFLQQAKKDITMAMYDFTSGDLMDEIVKIIKAKGLKFRMVLDHPPKNPTANQTDDVTRTTIIDAGPHAEVNWALTRNDPAVTEWVYPTAYHIKVVVRDGEAMWLSSGNFNVSNEPNMAANDPHKGSLKNADRDWHLVVLNKELAQLYKAYIDNDFTIAGGAQGPGNPVQHHLIRAAIDELQNESNKSTFQPTTAPAIKKGAKHKAPATVGHKVFDNVEVSIQPLLTPDKGNHTTMYVDNVLALINSAKKTLYMQTQYIHPSDKVGDEDFMLLVAAFKSAKDRGVKIKIILSQYENTPQWIEKLNEHDLVDGVLRIQNRVHNKGIVVDSKVVMVSSENWSADGVLRNRDAGMIIENAGIAAYFEAIFLDDWEKRADVKVVDESHPLKTKALLPS